MSPKLEKYILDVMEWETDQRVSNKGAAPVCHSGEGIVQFISTFTYIRSKKKW